MDERMDKGSAHLYLQTTNISCPCGQPFGSAL